MSLSTKEHYVLEVSVVDVSIHAEESLENDLDDVHKVLGERNPEGTGENLLVVKLVFDPGHQEVNVLLGTHFEWGLHVMTIGPKVLILGAC